MLLKAFVVYLILPYVLSKKDEDKAKTDRLNRNQHPPCKACKVYIGSFKNGMERTKNGRFEGGDTAWEEKKLGKYATSELRLTEIQEKICSEVEDGKDQCYQMDEQHREILETWWLEKQSEEPDPYDYFCIKTIKHCCPENRYGPECAECEPCDNGKCKGNGTRKGNGKCSCDAGYTGAKCNECAIGYYTAYRDDNNVICSKCHPSCDGPCSKPGPEGCEKCAPGWVMDKICVDVNECVKQPCGKNQFCVNNDGSFKCFDCHDTCDSCTGDGPDMCVECAEGYFFEDRICLNEERESRRRTVHIARYLTYAGLCVATCIIFKKNTAIAAGVGMMVAVYISASEYMSKFWGATLAEDVF